MKRNQAELQKKNASLTSELRQLKKSKGIPETKTFGRPSKNSFHKTHTSNFGKNSTNDLLQKGQSILNSENVLVENIESLLQKYQENLTSTLTKQMGLDINQAFETSMSSKNASFVVNRHYDSILESPDVGKKSKDGSHRGSGGKPAGLF